MSYIKRGKPEASLFIELHVYQGEIYANRYEKKLTRAGWVDCQRLGKKELNKSVRLVVKVRADSLGEEFVLDLKSTTGNARSESAMREKIKYYNYELSAAFYLDMFSLESTDGPITEFIWTFASKDCHNCKSYKASDRNILIGRKKYMGAILKLAYLIQNDWTLYDSLGVLEPHHTELYHLVESEADLL